jgi:negative regulator of flagellin synthesis FlgM
MVDSVNTSLGARARLQKLQSEGAQKTGASKPAEAGQATAVASVDSVRLSEAGTSQIGETLAAKGPPFDLELVAKIKQAIEDGRYPIDAQRITDSLFEGYQDMML